MADLNFEDEISAFLAIKNQVHRDSGPSWVVIVGRALQGVFPSYEEAVSFAIAKFPTTAFLIRHTDEVAPQIPLMVVGEG